MKKKFSKINHKLLSRSKSIFFFPLFSILFLLSGHALYARYAYLLRSYGDLNTFNFIENSIYWLGLALAVYWSLAQLVNLLRGYLVKYFLANNYQIVQIFIPFFAAIIKTILFLTLLNAIIPRLGFPDELAYLIEKISAILIISAIAWIFWKLIILAEQLILHRYSENKPENAASRKIFTQILIIKRVALVIVLILTAGSILMLFENVRALGASVLTTAGIIGVVLTFTAQRSLTSMFLGLEIALTQPIKIGDEVIIENEYGKIEEINFRSVVVKLWDWRRLIVPTNYFLEKPFQNWSRKEDNSLIGTVYLYVDFTLPLTPLRQHLTQILTSSSLWDSQVNNLQVTNLQDKVMELRVIASARNSGDSWDLRCLIREELINYIVQHYPACLPYNRNVTKQDISGFEKNSLNQTSLN